MSKSVPSIEIVTFHAKYARAFRELNEAWIDRQFGLEPRDIEVLGDPYKHFIQQQGEVFFADQAGAAVGSCAMLPVDAATCELSKMAVSEQCRGQGVGRKLAAAALDWAQARGFQQVTLETNRTLRAAMGLYATLGFVEIKHEDSEYVRCDVQMVRRFEDHLAP